MLRLTELVCGFLKKSETNPNVQEEEVMELEAIIERSAFSGLKMPTPQLN